ncbi:PH domain-containing protein [Modestobacter italicus]|uniref:PH domain-containing protein n=1 Tax=Modestobacter italicus (strain DSM 44449 / CECT 9708 / BC 501) TaxID=2732864 RepID=UPI001E3A2F3A|nr:PH domain-containing protein [Modestobacter marinus]
MPRRLRVLVAAAALGLLAATTVVALRLPSSSVGVVAFGPVDQVAIFGLGLIAAGAVLILGRPRVDADEHGVRVRNIATGEDLPWARVKAVRFETTSSWATLLLRNGDELAVLALQAADGERTVAAVRGLRSLLAAHQAAHAEPREDLLYPPG